MKHALSIWLLVIVLVISYTVDYGYQRLINSERQVKTLEQEKSDLLQQRGDLERMLQDQKQNIEDLNGQLQKAQAEKNALEQKQVKKPQFQLAGVEQWRDLVSRYDWPVDQALAIMKCESGGNPLASSSTNDQGLFQIHNGYALYGDDIYKPEFNISVAHDFYYAQRGWAPWSCARKLNLV